jgi:DNA primase
VREIVSLEPDEVILAYDMDKAGHDGAKEARRMLQNAGVMTRRVWWNPRYSDLAKMPLDIRRSTLRKILASTSTES